MKSKKPNKQQELLELGKKLEQFYNLGYINKKEAILFSFYKGLASGAGAFIGGTVIVGLVIWILSLFGQVPLLSHFTHAIRDSLN